MNVRKKKVTLFGKCNGFMRNFLLSGAAPKLKKNTSASFLQTGQENKARKRPVVSHDATDRSRHALAPRGNSNVLPAGCQATPSEPTAKAPVPAPDTNPRPAPSPVAAGEPMYKLPQMSPERSDSAPALMDFDSPSSSHADSDFQDGDHESLRFSATVSPYVPSDPMDVSMMELPEHLERRSALDLTFTTTASQMVRSAPETSPELPTEENTRFASLLKSPTVPLLLSPAVDAITELTGEPSPAVTRLRKPRPPKPQPEARAAPVQKSPPPMAPSAQKSPPVKVPAPTKPPPTADESPGIPALTTVKTRKSKAGVLVSWSTNAERPPKPAPKTSPGASKPMMCSQSPSDRTGETDETEYICPSSARRNSISPDTIKRLTVPSNKPQVKSSPSQARRRTPVLERTNKHSITPTRQATLFDYLPKREEKPKQLLLRRQGSNGSRMLAAAGKLSPPVAESAALKPTMLLEIKKPAAPPQPKAKPALLAPEPVKQRYPLRNRPQFSAPTVGLLLPKKRRPLTKPVQPRPKVAVKLPSSKSVSIKRPQRAKSASKPQPRKPPPTLERGAPNPHTSPPVSSRTRRGKKNVVSLAAPRAPKPAAQRAPKPDTSVKIPRPAPVKPAAPTPAPKPETKPVAPKPVAPEKPKVQAAPVVEQPKPKEVKAQAAPVVEQPACSPRAGKPKKAKPASTLKVSTKLMEGIWSSNHSHDEIVIKSDGVHHGGSPLIWTLTEAHATVIMEEPDRRGGSYKWRLSQARSRENVLLWRLAAGKKEQKWVRSEEDPNYKPTPPKKRSKKAEPPKKVEQPQPEAAASKKRRRDNLSTDPVQKDPQPGPDVVQSQAKRRRCDDQAAKEPAAMETDKMHLDVPQSASRVNKRKRIKAVESPNVRPRKRATHDADRSRSRSATPQPEEDETEDILMDLGPLPTRMRRPSTRCSTRRESMQSVQSVMTCATEESFYANGDVTDLSIHVPSVSHNTSHRSERPDESFYGEGDHLEVEHPSSRSPSREPQNMTLVPLTTEQQAPVEVTQPAPPVKPTQPAKQPAKPTKQKAKQAKQTAKPAKQTAKPAKPAKQTAEAIWNAGPKPKPAKQTTKPVKQTAKPAKQTTKPAKQTAQPAKQTAKPAKQTAKPAKLTAEAIWNAGPNPKPAKAAAKPKPKPKAKKPKKQPPPTETQQAEPPAKPAEPKTEPAKPAAKPQPKKPKTKQSKIKLSTDSNMKLTRWFTSNVKKEGSRSPTPSMRTSRNGSGNATPMASLSSSPRSARSIIKAPKQGKPKAKPKAKPKPRAKPKGGSKKKNTKKRRRRRRRFSMSAPMVKARKNKDPASLMSNLSLSNDRKRLAEFVRENENCALAWAGLTGLEDQEDSKHKLEMEEFIYIISQAQLILQESERKRLLELKKNCKKRVRFASHDFSTTSMPTYGDVTSVKNAEEILQLLIKATKIFTEAKVPEVKLKQVIRKMCQKLREVRKRPKLIPKASLRHARMQGLNYLLRQMECYLKGLDMETRLETSPLRCYYPFQDQVERLLSSLIRFYLKCIFNAREFMPKDVTAPAWINLIGSWATPDGLLISRDQLGENTKDAEFLPYHAAEISLTLLQLANVVEASKRGEVVDVEDDDPRQFMVELYETIQRYPVMMGVAAGSSPGETPEFRDYMLNAWKCLSRCVGDARKCKIAALSYFFPLENCQTWLKTLQQEMAELNADADA